MCVKTRYSADANFQEGKSETKTKKLGRFLNSNFSFFENKMSYLLERQCMSNNSRVTFKKHQ